MMDNPKIAIASIGALGGLCQWLAWRFKLPSILFLLTAGLLVNVPTLVTVVCVFVFAEALQHESGLLAVTIMGV